MEYIYKSLKTVLLFVVMVLISQQVAGDNFTKNMCIVILASMLILNADVVSKAVSAVSNTITYYYN